MNRKEQKKRPITGALNGLFISALFNFIKCRAKHFNCLIEFLLVFLGQFIVILLCNFYSKILCAAFSLGFEAPGCSQILDCNSEFTVSSI